MRRQSKSRVRQSAATTAGTTRGLLRRASNARPDAQTLSHSAPAVAFDFGRMPVLSGAHAQEADRLSEETSGVREVLRSPGRPLDAETLTFMEPRFGHDFSRVRVHTDAHAARTAGRLHADAYTVGEHIVFAEGRFAPSTSEGDRLLAHELAHVVQGAGQSATLRRQPEQKGVQADEAILRVSVVDTLEATKRSAIDALVNAIERGDRAFLQGLGLSSKQVDHLLNHTPQFEMTFGTAAELAVEQAVRADPFLSAYVKRGPVGRVPRGVGKPDWRIETPSSSIPVDLMTPQQVEEKLSMWRRQSTRGKPKWYVEKGLNITYERPAGLKAPGPHGPGLPAGAAEPAAAPRIGSVVTKTSGLRAAGRFLARETPNLLLQAVVMVIFPPGVNIHNDKAGELVGAKLNPAVEEALAKQGPAFDKLQDADYSKSIYANVTFGLDYTVGGDSGGSLELYLKDLRFLGLQITREDLNLNEPKFDQTGPGIVSKQMTYSILLYESEYVKMDREWAQKQQAYQECLRKFGTGYIPPPAGAEAAEAAQRNPESGPCIPPRMEPMEGP